jgi:hypothetical protein
MPRRSSAHKRHDWRPHFLAALRDTGIVTDACKIADVARSTAYEERQRNEDFALAWHDVEEETTERMEREAVRRAAEGVERAVYHQGEVVGHERHFSDVLLMFMLKARRPETYRETTRHEHTGANGGPISFADLAAHAAQDAA